MLFFATELLNDDRTLRILCYAGWPQVNHLYKADFFGERALFTSEPRTATVVASGMSPLICLTLKRNVFVEVLGPLQNLMVREKIDMVSARALTLRFSRLK